MSKKIDPRLPERIGEGAGLKDYVGIRSPWGKLFDYRAAMHYANRYEAVIGAAVMQAYRILIPDYRTRSKLMCEDSFRRLLESCRMTAEGLADGQNVHPFMVGEFSGALCGDAGDDNLLMCGRVQDFGTYRAEKELDQCPWDIIGSELCRATTMSLQGTSKAYSEMFRDGPTMEYCMVEAKGCGDLHCRIVAENRDKYPMPEHEIWESFGPVATADQIHFTPEEDCVKEPQVFREECNYTWSNGTNAESDSSSVNYARLTTGAGLYLLPAIDAAVEQGITTREFADHVLKCVMEAAGKAMFGEQYATQALRLELGVPNEIGEDGRLAGGHVEMVLQALTINYEVEAFNKNEVILVIDRKALEINGNAIYPNLHVWLWNGAVKTMVNAQWSLWEEDSPEGKLRIKIAKKIDKFC